MDRYNQKKFFCLRRIVPVLIVVCNFGSASGQQQAGLKICSDFYDSQRQGLYQSALQRNPRDYVALYRRGKDKERSNDLSGALADFRQSLLYNPFKSEHCKPETSATDRTMRAWVNQEMGYIFCLQRKFQMGVDALSRAIVLRPNYAYNYQNRAAAYKALGKIELSTRDMAKAEYLRRVPLPDACSTAPTSLELGKSSPTSVD